MNNKLKKIGVFGVDHQMIKQIRWKKKLVNLCRRNVILILQILVWIHRIFGVTFGGLIIDSNESLIKLSVNRYYKWYGCLLTMILSSLDLFNLLLFDFDPYKFAEQMGFEGLPQLLPILFTSVGVIWCTSRTVMMYHNNIYGYKLAQLLYKSVDYQVNSLVDLKVVLIPVTWTVLSFLIISLSLYLCPTRNIDQIIVLIEFIFGFICLSSIFSNIWIISIVHANKLDQIEALLNG